MRKFLFGREPVNQSNTGELAQSVLAKLDEFVILCQYMVTLNMGLPYLNQVDTSSCCSRDECSDELIFATQVITAIISKAIVIILLNVLDMSGDSGIRIC